MSNASLLSDIDTQAPAMPDTGPAGLASALGAAESETTPAKADGDTTVTMASVITSALAAHRRRITAAAASRPQSARNAFD